MIKKLYILLLVVLLSSCFGDDDGLPSDSSSRATFESNDFSMEIPLSWNLINNKDSILPKPSNGEIVFDVVSQSSSDNFYRNILVLKQPLNSDISSVYFMVGNYLSSTKDYFYTKLISERNTLIDGKETRIYNFHAKYSEDTPIANFLQTAIVCDKNAFLITVALEKDNKNIERYESLLGTFSCKN